MILYILNSEYKEVDMIDSFESLIWTERFDTLGDFELVTFRRTPLQIGSIVAIAESKRMMVVEKIETSPVEGGGLKIVHSGRSFESVLDQRVGYYPKMAPSQEVLARTLMNAMLVGEDAIPGLLDLSRASQLYPYSELPTSTDAAAASSSGWHNLLNVHESFPETHRTGYRFVRDRDNARVHYDTYTGNNRSVEGGTFFWDHHNVDLALPDPYFTKAGGEFPVVTNLMISPGFTEKHRVFTPKLPDGSARDFILGTGAEIDVVDVPEARSGKGLRLRNKTPYEANTSWVFLTGAPAQLGDIWDGSVIGGRRYVVKVKCRVDQVMTGTQHAYSRGLAIFWEASGSGTVPKAVVRAPNTIGVHELSVGFDLPATGSSFNVWNLRLINGSGSAGQSVTWYDMVMIEIPPGFSTASPNDALQYFDGNYSFDPDLTPRWDDTETNSFGRLYGKQLAGWDSTEIIQSNQTPDGRPCARLINYNRINYDNARIVTPDNRKIRRVEYRLRLTDTIGWRTGPMGSARMNASPWPTGYQYDSPEMPNTPNVEYTHVKTFDPSTEPVTTIHFRKFHNDWSRSIFIDYLIAYGNAFVPSALSPAVIFSEALDNFILDKSVTDITNWKNVAYVTNPEVGTVVVVANGVGEGVLRRVMHVDASGLSRLNGPLHTQMGGLGQEALSKQRQSVYLDGLVPSYSRYKYDEDYFLGDLVGVVDRFNNRITARVVEQIFVEDAEGYRTYPTLEQDNWLEEPGWSHKKYDIIWPSAVGTWPEA